MSESRKAGVMLAVSGLAGLLLGLGQADWQWAVEHAQVIAGIVSYPPDSPVAIAHAKLWSLTAQLGGLLMSVGVSEIVLAKLLSGLLGLVSFMALAAVVYALGRDAVLAVGAVFVIVVSQITDYGVSYPIALLGTAHTHGVLGLSFGVLAAGLIGMGWYRAGGFLLALSPAVHGALGVWLVVVAGLAVLSADRETRSALLTGWRAFAAGVAIAIVSYAVHRAIAPSVAPIDAATASRYLQTFVATWDGHRQPVDLLASGVRLSAGVVVLSAIWIGWFGRLISPPARFLLRATVIGGVLSLALAAWSGLAPTTMPEWMVVFMPGRLLNVTVMIAGAVVLGLFAAMSGRRVAQVLLLILAAALVASNRSVLWTLIGSRPWRLDALSVLSFAAVALIGVAWTSVRAGRPAAGSRAWRLAAVVVMAVAAATVGLDTIRGLPARAAIFRDRTNDPVFEAASRGNGALLTGGELFLIQLRTRRPVLLDGGTLDTLPYALESGPAMDGILRDVYGIDLFKPPAEARLGGRVPANANRQVWEPYSAERWREIGQRYRVTEVLTPEGWALDLPLIAQSPGFSLYGIGPGTRLGRIANHTSPSSERMVSQQIAARGIQHPGVLDAMRRVPRHRFVPESQQADAYDDTALPIGEGQTISQPYIVAYMTEALEPRPTDRVLEIGTGSGYQAAILAELVQDLYTIEIVPALATRARTVLEALGYTNIHARLGDGYRGWPEAAPFDKIIVTAAPDEVPKALVDQLAVGGIMVVPVGRGDQVMTVVRKTKDGVVQQETIGVRFVPMIKKDRW